MGRHRLHYAAVDGDNTTLRRLLDEGTDADVLDKQSFTALQFASLHGNLGGVQALLAAGADPNRQNAMGNNALRMAIQAPRDVEAIITALMSHGADPDVENKAGSSTAAMVRLMEREDLAALMGIDL